MDKYKAQTILDWWRDKFYWKDEADSEDIWSEFVGSEIVTYTMKEIKEFINVAPI